MDAKTRAEYLAHVQTTPELADTRARAILASVREEAATLFANKPATVTDAILRNVIRPWVDEMLATHDSSAKPAP